MITFLVSGLWHGAGLTYLVWGGLHGLCQAAENHLPPRARVSSAMRCAWRAHSAFWRVRS